MTVFVAGIYADSTEESNISASNDLNKKAYSLQKEGKFTEALSVANQSIQQNPNNYYAWGTKASILIQLNRNDEALIALNQALQLKPNDPTLMNMKNGLSYNEGGTNKSTDSDADSANDFFNKGNAFIKVHNYSKALDAFNQSIQLNPNDARAWNNMAYILLQQKRLNEALNAINQSNQLNPQFATAWNTRGYILKELGLSKEAIDAFNKVLEVDSNNESSNYRRAKGEIARLQKKLKSI